MNITVTFERDEVEKILCAEYERLFGKPQDGYELHCNLSEWGESKIYSVEKAESVESED